MTGRSPLRRQMSALDCSAIQEEEEEEEEEKEISSPIESDIFTVHSDGY